MLRGGTSLLGIVNFVTFLISIPILGGGIWLASRANTTDCISFLQWPIIVIGLTVMVVSLMGFAGACYRQTWLLRLYLFAMFFIVVALLFFIVFAFAVTDRGDGQVVMNRRFLEYQLSDYNGWLKERVVDPQYWAKISACLRDGHACKGMRRVVRDPNTGMPMEEPPGMFYARNLSPIQSGCCKPPSSCAFTYRNETWWETNSAVPTVVTDVDCRTWNNDQQTLCFNCDSCKAGVLASIKKSWRKVAILNIVVLIILVIVYVAGCAAFRNARRIENDEPIGMARMTKSQPSRFQF